MAARDAQAGPGVIDCLSQGFAQVNRVLWVTLFPIALDVFLWAAPRISAAPLAERWLNLWSQTLAEASAAGSAGGPLDSQSIDLARSSIDGSAIPDLLSLLAGNVASVAVPAIVPAQRLLPGQVFEVVGLGSFLALVAGLQLVGLLLGCVYLGLIGQQVREGRVSLNRLGPRVWRYWLNALGFICLLIATCLALSLPLGLIVLVLSLVAPSLAAAVTLAFWLGAAIAWLCALIYLFFVADAIVLGELGPVAAIKSSVWLVRRHLGPSLTLIVLIVFISLGMQQIWGVLSRQSWGLGLAVVGNAYVASGLAAASMLFYRHRAAPPRPRTSTVSRGAAS